MKNVVLFTCCLLICSNITSAGRKTEKSYINWRSGEIEAYGMADITIKNGHPVDPDSNKRISINKGRMIAYHNAKEAAKLQLISLIKKIRIDSDRNMLDLLMQSNITRSRLAQIIDNNIKILLYPVDYFKVSCQARIKIADMLPAVPYTYPVDEFPTPLKTPVQTKYSGLIIDARGIGIKAMVLPVIYNEGGLEIYSKNFIDPKYATRHGLVSYVHTEQEAQQHIKAGDKPYFTIALKSNKDCPVITDKDAKRLLSNKDTIESLKKCRVIFIIDRNKL